MTWEKTYSLIGWKNKNVSLTTPLGATLLNRIDNALNVIDNRVIELNKNKLESGDINEVITGVSYNNETGVITFTKYNGSVQSFDLSDYLDNLNALVEAASASATTASQKASEASSSAGAAASSAATATTKASEASTSATQAKQYRDEAETYAKNASAVTGVSIASKGVAGLMRGGDNLIGADGELILTKTTTDRTLYDSHPGGLKVNSIEGESQQNQYTGKNLYDEVLLNKSYSHSGITLAKDSKTGNLTISGTATANTNMIMDAITLPAGTYYFQKGTTNGFTIALYNQTTKTFIVYGNGSFTLTEESTLDVRIQCSAGGTTSGTIKIQIEEGSTMTDYEPYVGNQPSPNPDYPQDINSVVVSEIWGCGKNQLKNTATTQTINGINFTVNSDKSVTVNGTATADAYFVVNASVFRPIPNTEYIFTSGVPYNDNYIAYVANVDGNPQWVLDKQKFKPTTNHYIYSSIYVKKGATINNLIYQPMIRLASIEDDTYEPYTEKRIKLSNPITLRGMTGGQDIIDVESGKEIQSVYVVKPNTSSNWNKHEASTADYLVAYLYIEHSNLVNYEMMSTHFTRISDSELGKKSGFYLYRSGNTASIHVSIPTSIASDVTALKTWMVNNNVEFHHPIKTPIETDLPVADQIALHQLETFGTVTHLFTDSTIEPVMEVEYGTSVVGGYAIKGMNATEVEKLTVPVNNLLATVPGNPLDAVQGKNLGDRLSELENNSGLSDAVLLGTVQIDPDNFYGKTFISDDESLANIYKYLILAIGTPNGNLVSSIITPVGTIANVDYYITSYVNSILAINGSINARWQDGILGVEARKASEEIDINLLTIYQAVVYGIK